MGCVTSSEKPDLKVETSLVAQSSESAVAEPCEHKWHDVVSDPLSPPTNVPEDVSRGRRRTNTDIIVPSLPPFWGDPHSLANYQLIDLLGRGTYSNVFSCRRRTDGAYLAIRVINLATMPRSDIDLFNIEIDFQMQFDYLHIMRVFDSFIEPDPGGDKRCIVMEYCRRGTLARCIRKMKDALLRPSEEVALLWFAQIALAAKYYHMRHVLHRDIKPSNIFITGDGMLQLGDFRLARALNSTADFSNTVIGTPYYMPPEMFHGAPYSYKTDVWSLGCVLYELLTGNRPFETQRTQSLISLSIRIATVEPDLLPPHYSDGLQRLVEYVELWVVFVVGMGSKMFGAPEWRPTMSQILLLPILQPALNTLQGLWPNKVFQLPLTPQLPLDESAAINGVTLVSLGGLPVIRVDVLSPNVSSPGSIMAEREISPNQGAVASRAAVQLPPFKLKCDSVDDHWKLMLQHGFLIDNLTDAIYERLFNSDPKIRLLFSRSDMSKQRRMFSHMFLGIVSLSRLPPLLFRGAIEAMVAAHAKLGIEHNMWAVMHTIILTVYIFKMFADFQIFCHCLDETARKFLPEHLWSCHERGLWTSFLDNLFSVSSEYLSAGNKQTVQL